MPGITAGSGNGGVKAVSAHEREHLARIGRELQLEELLPHLLLRAAEDRHVAGEAERPRHHLGAKAQHLVDGFHDLWTNADHIAEINDAVTGLQTAGEAIMERGEPLGLAVNGRDGPNATGPSQYCVDWRVAGS